MSKKMVDSGDDNREARIDALLAFQSEELNRLLEKRAKVDKDLEIAQAKASAAADHVSAARALVAARAVGAVLHEDLGVDEVDEEESDHKHNESNDDGRNIDTTSDAMATPIGVLYSSLQKRWEAPRQSFIGTSSSGVLVLRESLSQQISPGDKLVLLYWLDRNGSLWRQFVRPPRRVRSASRLGVLATRSPHRPTPIGLSICTVRTVSESKTILHIDGLDVLDETPVLSVRLYNDAYPHASAGWLTDDANLRPLHYDAVASRTPQYQVNFSVHAEQRLSFVAQRSNADVRTVVHNSLARGRGRRGVLPIGAFRVLFETDTNQNLINVVDVVSGFRDQVCAAEGDIDPEARLHAEFKSSFG